MSKPAKMLTAALYARFSSDLQKDRSIDDQFRDLERAATRFRFKLNKSLYFSDKAQSGTSLFDRPGLTRELLGASAKNRFDVVLVEATDRLSRSQADLFWLADRFKFDNVKIFTPAGEVSEMQLTFDSHSNADMVKKLAIRVKRGHDGIAREGKIAGALSYGYDAVPGKPGERTLNKIEATVVRRIFEEYAAGRTPRQIVDGLAKDKIPSPSGAPFWNHQVIVGGLNKRGLIHNRLYIGEYVKNRFYNVKNPSTGKRITRKAEESDLIVAPIPHLRIVEQPLWDAAHKIRTERGVKKFGPAGCQRAAIPRKDHLLSGLVRCAACGGAMTVTASSRTTGHRVACSSATYRKTCNHTKSYDLMRLTNFAIDKMRDQLADPELFKERAKAKAEEKARLARQDDEERKTAQKQLDRLNVQISRLAEAVADSDKPVKELVESIKAKEIERVALQERVRLLGAETNVTALHPTAIAAFGRSVKTLHAKLKENPKDPECRLAFANVIDSVVVHPTLKGADYEISLYGRLSAITGVDLFPARRSFEEVLAAEGLPRIGSGGSILSRPRLSRRSTGWSSH
jgi:site-specific DNA recombinase